MQKEMALKRAAVRVKKGKLEQQNVGYLLILPNYLIYLIFTLIPVCWTIYMSFTDYNLKTYSFVGFENYAKLFQDKLFIKSFFNTLYYTVLTVPICMCIGLCLALMLNRKIPARGVFRVIFYLPYILSMVAVSMAWLYLYDTQGGILNRMLKAVGLSGVPWVSSAAVAMLSVAIMSIWAGVGYDMIVFLSGLQSIPDYLYEAASIDGATGWKQFLHITLPSLRPTTFFIFVMACIRSFQVFGQVYILTNGGPKDSTTTLAHQIYRNGFEYYKMGYASAEAVVLLLIIVIITVINMKYGKGDENDAG